MGRPPKAGNEKQSERVTVWITRAERRSLEREAADAGLTLGGYLRELWLKNRRG